MNWVHGSNRVSSVVVTQTPELNIKELKASWLFLRLVGCMQGTHSTHCPQPLHQPQSQIYDEETNREPLSTLSLSCSENTLRLASWLPNRKEPSATCLAIMLKHKHLGLCADMLVFCTGTSVRNLAILLPLTQNCLWGCLLFSHTGHSKCAFLYLICYFSPKDLVSWLTPWGHI